MPLFFNHITKTAGTTVQLALSRCVADDSALLGIRSEKLSSYSFYLNTPTDLHSYEIVSSHLGERVRRFYFPNHFAVVLLREPVSRYKSLLHYAARLGNTGIINDLRMLLPDVGHFMARPETRTLLMAHSMTNNIYPDWMTSTSSSVSQSVFDPYSMVLTPRGLAKGLSVLLSLYGRAPIDALSRHNSKPVEQKAIIFPENFEHILREMIPEEFQIYEMALQREEMLLSDIDANPLEVLHLMRGQLARKLCYFKLDWMNPPDFTGWSTVQYSSLTGLEKVPARIMIDGRSSLYLPLVRDIECSGTMLLWCNRLVSAISGVRLLIDGEPVHITDSNLLPTPCTGLYRLFFPIPRSSQRGFTEVSIELPKKTEAELLWLFDLLVSSGPLSS